MIHVVEPFVLIVVFMILSLTIHPCLRQCKMFSGHSATVLAMCVSFLCLLGMSQMFFPVTPRESLSGGNDSPRFIPLLIPYAALAIAMLTLLLWRLFGNAKKKKHIINTSTGKFWPSYLTKQENKQVASAYRLTKPRGDTEYTKHCKDAF